MSNKMMNKASKLALASAAAALFSSAIVPAALAGETPESTSVKCQGINACKGQSKCNTATNACAGQNACKGKGWLVVPTAEECTAKGGTAMPAMTTTK